MKFYPKLYVCLAAILLLSMYVYAGLEEHSLLVGSGVRQIGMGSASTASAISSWNTNWNPATLRELKEVEVSLFDSPLQPDSVDREGGMAIALGARQVGLSQVDIGMLGMTSWFDGWRNDHKKNRVIVAGYGLPINKEFSLGIGIRHQRQSNEYGTVFDWGLDIGMLYSHKLKMLGEKISAGAAVNKIQLKKPKGRKGIPVISRLGVAYYPDENTIFSCDIAYHNDSELPREERFRVYIGAERWLFDEIIGIRVGYTGIVNYDKFTDGEWTRGFSLQTGLGEISYAYVSGKLIEPGRHFISTTLRWGKVKTEDEEISVETEDIVSPEPILMPEEIIQFEINPTVTIPYEVFSPNNDGIKDIITVELDIGEGQSWILEIKNEYGETVKAFTGNGIPVEPASWDGKNSEGKTVRDGTYVSNLTVSGQIQDVSNTIIVDTIPPSLSMSTEPLIIISQSKREHSRELVLNVPKIHIRVSDENDIAEWSLEISDKSGNVLQKFGGKDKPKYEIVWDSWEEKILVKDEPQQFYCKGKVKDIAGNQATADATISALDINKVSGRRDERGVVLSLSSVTFDTNQYKVKSEYHDALKEATEVIKAYPEAKVQIEGHTDDIGDDSYNLELSKKRANAVMKYFVENFGISPERLTAIGYGESQPIASNQTTEGRQKNRRVDIVLLTVDDPEENRKLNTEDTEFTRKTQKTRDSQNAISNTGRYVIQVGSFKQQINAETVVKIIKHLELDYRIWVSEVLIRGSTWYRVMLGEFPDRKSAEEIADFIKKELDLEPSVTKKK